MKIDSQDKEQHTPDLELDPIINETTSNKPNTHNVLSNNIVTCDDNVSKPEYKMGGQKCVFAISTLSKGNYYVYYNSKVSNTIINILVQSYIQAWCRYLIFSTNI